jgi:hypothetical protein
VYDRLNKLSTTPCKSGGQRLDARDKLTLALVSAVR